jgi:DNA-binding transcriptional MocR family regulator
MTSWTPTIDRARPRYVAIADAIAADLAAGRLKSGDRLPPHRELAWKLGVTVGTVTRAYQEAEKRGLLTGEVGRGSFVRDPAPAAAALKALIAGPELGMLDMQTASPPRVHLQSEFADALAEIGRDPDFEDLLDYGPPGGHRRHRQTGARWLARAGIDVPPERVLISAGAQASLIACLASIGASGERVLIEPLSYPTMRPITRQLGLVLKPLQADENGIVPESLDEMARRGEGRIVYLVPTLHNPTTITMPKDRREEIAEVAKRHDLLIVEDDVFRYLADDPPPTLYSLAPERTYHIQSLSKTMAPGLRVGFMALPSGSVADVVRQQLILGGRPVSLAVELARRWIESGAAERILRAIRAETKARRDIALDVLARHELSCGAGALYLWLALPGRWRPAEFANAAQAIGIKMTPGTAFAMDHAAPNRVRLCFGPAASREALRDGLQRLRGLLDRGPVEEFQTMA